MVNEQSTLERDNDKIELPTVTRPAEQLPRGFFATVARWLKRAVGLTLILALCVAVPALGWQSRQTMQAEKKYPPRGEFVDVGGHKLHYILSGADGPTVVMESNIGAAGTFAWMGLEDELAKFSRVLTYDRAGLGWSESGTLPRTTVRQVQELHKLLSVASIPKPYYLVGFGYGGVNVQLYASLYPDEVAGLLLLDSVNLNSFTEDSIPSLTTEQRIHYALRHLGTQRMLYQGYYKYESKDVAATRLAACVEMHSRASNFEAVVDELQGRCSWVDARSQIRNLGNLPITIISAKQTSEMLGWPWWRRGQEALVRDLGSYVKAVGVECSHQIHLERPAAVVTELEELLEPSRAIEAQLRGWNPPGSLAISASSD